MAIGESTAETGTSRPIHMEAQNNLEISRLNFLNACQEVVDKARGFSHLPDISLIPPDTRKNHLKLVELRIRKPGEIITAYCPPVTYSVARKEKEFKPRQTGIVTPDGLVFPLETDRDPVSPMIPVNRLATISVPVNSEGEPQTGELIKGAKQNPLLSEGLYLTSSFENHYDETSSVIAREITVPLSDPEDLNKYADIIRKSIENGGVKESFGFNQTEVSMPPSEDEVPAGEL